jgi:hypothetical protein
MMSTELNTIQPIRLMAGHLTRIGAPILYLSLLYNTEEGSLNGEAVITQSVTPPGGRVVVRHVSGVVHGLGLNGATRAVTVQGEYAHSLPPPAFGTVLEKFSATFVTDNNWKGHGSYQFGGTDVANVPVGPYG